MKPPASDEDGRDEGNLFEGIPADLPRELVTALAGTSSVRVERIVSQGHVSPPDFWYDQEETELVFVIAGQARLMFEGEGERALGPGDWVQIRPHVRHRVTHTATDQNTIWLAVFYG
jgi:cupin 2 domain-containing protein